MNAFVLSFKSGRRCSGVLLPVPGRTILLPAVLLIFACQHIAFGQSDDFNDGNDNGWAHFDPFGTATFTFPNDNFGGKAYRIQCAASPNASFGPGRVSGSRSNVYDDFYAGVDLAAWDNTLNQAFGLIFRAANIGPGTNTGYVLNYDPQQSAGGRGQIQFNAVTNVEPVD